MIGSQATKGMHVLARFAPTVERCGVWTDSQRLHAIEAYPAACRRSTAMCELLEEYVALQLDHIDQRYALVCALIAWLFHFRPELLARPNSDVPEREGWIFTPVDGLA